MSTGTPRWAYSIVVIVVVVVVGDGWSKRRSMDNGMNFKYLYHLVFIFRTGLQHPTDS